MYPLCNCMLNQGNHFQVRLDICRQAIKSRLQVAKTSSLTTNQVHDALISPSPCFPLERLPTATTRATMRQRADSRPFSSLPVADARESPCPSPAVSHCRKPAAAAAAATATPPAT